MGQKGKGSLGNFFEDFTIGQELPCPVPRVVGAAETAWHIATTNDRTPRFCNAEGRIHPLIVFHVVIGQTVRQVSLNSPANLGYAGMIWRTPVFNGDEISTTIEITGLKENSRRDTGNVYVKTTGRNQRGEVVLEYTRWVMVRKRDTETATRYLDEPVVPELPKSVPIDQLPPWTGPLPDPARTGGGFFFEDYEVGERIFHHDGSTVNQSDHMQYTRLWQNSAKVHFDEILTEGKPLVYGGFVIATAYAQAFNGLENRSGIVAMNSGAHANPTRTGTTIYSFSEVLEKHGLGDAPAGALRLRLVAVKDTNPANEPDLKIKVRDDQGRERYDSRVLLDLDYFELMPKRGV